MKILHVALAGKFSDNWLYQENLLTKQNVLDGNETVLVATTRPHFCTSKNPEERVYTDSNSVKIYRINSPRFMPSLLQSKLRYYPKLAEILRREKPDLVFHHGVQGLSLLTVLRYVKSRPKVKLYADSHSDYMNSAKNFFSKWILNKVIYKFIIKLSLPRIEKVFYVTKPRGAFLKDMYGLPDTKIEFMPLGGFEISDNDYRQMRKSFRTRHGIADTDVVFLHAGKFCAEKKTANVISVFSRLNMPNAKLVLAGRWQGTGGAEGVLRRENIIDLGWVDPANMHELMCGCDVFIQPGLHSVMFEQAALCRLVLVLADMEHNRFLLGAGNGILVENDEDISNAIRRLSSDKETLAMMKENVERFARENLVYSKILERLFT